MTPVKPGWATTEFWSTIATLVLAVAAALAPGRDVSEPIKTVAAAAAGISNAVYVIARAHVKGKAASSAPPGAP